MLKQAISTYFPNQMDNIRSIKRFLVSVANSYSDLMHHLAENRAKRLHKVFSSRGLTQKLVAKHLFDDFYPSAKKLNLIYLGKLNLGHRFIFIDHDKCALCKELKSLMENGFIIKVEQKSNSFILKKNTILYIKRAIGNLGLIRVYRQYMNEKKVIEFKSDISIEIEYWFMSESQYQTKAKNNIQNKLSKKNIQNCVEVLLHNKPVRQIKDFSLFFYHKKKNTINNIDLVYTWVDDQDETWQKKKECHEDSANKALHISATSKSRYHNKDELKYSLRSVEKYLTGYRKIFIVTDNQKPIWLQESDKIVLIDHKEIFPDLTVLPTFNSHAIEANLHRIKGLSEHYLYLNDDIFFGKSIDVSFFFAKEGIVNIFPSRTTYIPFENSNKDLLPVDSAAINARELLHKLDLGYAVNKYKHTPLPQVKSILFELDYLFDNFIKETASHRFRDPRDISLTSSLFFNYCRFTGRGFEKKIQYSYFNLAQKNDILRLKNTISREPYLRPQVFCVNDVIENHNYENIAEEFNSIMEGFLPEKSSFESNL